MLRKTKAVRGQSPTGSNERQTSKCKRGIDVRTQVLKQRAVKAEVRLEQDKQGGRGPGAVMGWLSGQLQPRDLENAVVVDAQASSC